ncbi:PA2928 family protein [Ferruginibacter sp.]
MRLVTKIFTGGVLFIGLLIAGFVFLLKGCLSKYDERYALPTVLYFEQPDKAIMFSIVKYDETTSYQQHNGFISKSFDNHCFIQSNNATTGEKIQSKELKRPDKKNYNEEALGASGSNAWVFIDELMAFNAFTLEKVADVKIIEQKNPQLKGMLPKENRYYHFNDADKSISITVKDGSRWKLNTTTLLATPEEEKEDKDMDMEERERLSVLKNLQRSNVSYTDMFVNQDTVAPQWFGLYSREEIQKLDGWIRIGTAYTGEARRQFFTTAYTHIRDNHFELDKTTLKNSSSDYFLDGGFLLNRQTAEPVKGNNDDGYFIIYKSQVGNEGEILLCLVNNAGKVLWRLNSGLNSWTDWHFSGNRLLILGADNKNLGSSKCNVLISVDTGTGQASSYDFFTDKTRQAIKEK